MTVSERIPFSGLLLPLQEGYTYSCDRRITGGIGNGLFGSDNNCTRAQVVTFLYRYVE